MWDGVDSKGVPFPDGAYQATLYAVDEVGNQGHSAAAAVAINGAKPVLVVAPEEEAVPDLMPEVKTEETDRGLVIPLAAEVLFETGKAEIRPDAFATLDEAAAIVRKYVGRRISIEGHTDNVPIHDEKFASNKTLSQSRAEAVRHYFVDVRKLDGTRLTAKGWATPSPSATTPRPKAAARTGASRSSSRRKARRRTVAAARKAGPARRGGDDGAQ